MLLLTPTLTMWGGRTFSKEIGFSSIFNLQFTTLPLGGFLTVNAMANSTCAVHGLGSL